MSTDNGAAALAERLHEGLDDLLCSVQESADSEPYHDMPDHWWGVIANQLLGERGVFLPEGLDGLIAKVEALPTYRTHALAGDVPASDGNALGPEYRRLDDVIALLRGER